MANLSNINNKFLFTDGDFLKIGNLAPINNISGTESGISITNGNCASITLDNSAAQGKTFSIYSAVNGSLNFYDVDANSGRLIIDTSGNSTFAGNVSVNGEARVYTGSNLSYWGVDAGNSYVYLGTNSTGYGLSLQTGGIDRVNINDAGNVFISTPITNAFYGLSLTYNSNNTADFTVNQATGQIKIGGVLAGYYPTFYAGGSERIRIENTGVMKFANTATSTGDVGTIAHYTNNYMYIRGGTGGLAIGDDGFDTNIYLNNSNSIQLQTGGSEKMRINSQGQTWLGGSFTGSDIANGNGTYLNNLNAGGFSVLHRNAADVYLHFNTYYNSSNNYTAKYGGSQGFRIDNGSTGGLGFYKAPVVTTAGDTQTFSHVMQVGYGASNNVGIGTTSPGEKLEVNGVIQIKRVGDHPAIRFVENTTTRGYIGTGDWAINGLPDADLGISSASTGSLVLGTNSGNGRVYIVNGGNVGIGTDSPRAVGSGYKGLEVSSSSSGSSLWLSGFSDSTKGYLAMDTGGLNLTAISNHSLTFGTNNSPKMTILSSGNVGIATTSPGAAKLYVNGGTTLGGSNNTDAGATRIFGDIKRPQANNFVRRNYYLTAGSSSSLYSIARQWHDHANWGLGNINVIMWGIYYGQGQYNKADFSCRYGYSGGGADVQTNFNPNGMVVPSWTSATQVSGNIHYRDLQIQIPAYYQISFEIISPGCVQTYNINNTANNTVYLYPH